MKYLLYFSVFAALCIGEFHIIMIHAQECLTLISPAANTIPIDSGNSSASGSGETTDDDMLSPDIICFNSHQPLDLVLVVVSSVRMVLDMSSAVVGWLWAL